jgi:FkbM family methyltransferase
MEPGFEKYYTQYPLVLVDVGASGGLESDWKPAKKYLQIIGFEPDKREFPNLERKENGNIKYLNIGLFNKKATLDYFLTEKQQTSSMLKPNGEFIKKFPESERFNIVKKITVETDTIDSQFQSHHIDDVDFIKLDTQGSELSILEGAQATIKDHVFGLEIEVEFSELYQGQPLFSDIDSFVRKKGFQLFDIQGHYWKRTSGKNRYKKRGQLIFGDALYLRKAEDFSGMIGMMPN